MKLYEVNVEDLVNRLNEYGEKSDHFDYFDAYDNKGDGYDDILNTLNTDLKGIEDIIRYLHSETQNEEREDILKEASDLLKDMELYRKWFIVKNTEYEFHSDAGHGWLAVPLWYLDVLEIKHDISSFSYVDENDKNNKIAYLEEDLDAGVFLSKYKAIFNQNANYMSVNDGNESIIRSYDSYKYTSKERQKELDDYGSKKKDEYSEPYSTKDIINWSLNHKDISYKEYLNNNKKENVMANENTIWVNIPASSIKKEAREKTYANGNKHKVHLVSLPEKDGKRLAFEILEGQAVPSKSCPFDEVVQIPISEYGFNLFELKGKDEAANENSQIHKDQKEFESLIKEVYKNLNNPEVKYIKLPADCFKDMTQKEDESKKFVSVHLPKYMQKRDDFVFSNASLNVNKAYHFSDKSKGELRAIQCVPDDKSYLVIKNFDKEIQVSPMDLFKYNNEDYLKSLNKDNEKVSSAKDIKANQPKEEAKEPQKNENTGKNKEKSM